MSKMEVACFVYGTLRIGHGNHSWAQDGVIREIPNATIRGKIYFVTGRRGYPIAKLNRDGEIKGDILIFDEDSKEWDDVHRMESGAGYRLRPVVATLEDGTEVPVVAWHYQSEPRGELIESGDWAKEVDEWLHR